MPPYNNWNRIEKKYSPGILVGNWFEERQEYKPEKFEHSSTHERDYKEVSQRPDKTLRRVLKQRIQNNSYKKLLEHHGDAYYNNNISWYDEHYNKTRPEWDKLPDLRNWNLHKVAWVPEASDIPRRGPPTNWGLKLSLDDRARQYEEYLSRPNWESTYQGSFNSSSPYKSEQNFPKRSRSITVDTSALLHPWNNNYVSNEYRNKRHFPMYPEELKKVTTRPRNYGPCLGPADSSDGCDKLTVSLVK